MNTLQAAQPVDFETRAYRIAGRAEILRNRVASVYEDPSTQSPDLYYFIINTLYDAHGLYRLGDTRNAAVKIGLLDTITYDLVCAGTTAAVEMNRSVALLQRSSDAAKIDKFKNLAAECISSLSRRGLLESVQFTHVEEQYFAALANRMKNVVRGIDSKITQRELINLLIDHGRLKTDSISFRMPESVQPPLSRFLFGVRLDEAGVIHPQLYFESPDVSREIALLAVFSVTAFHAGLPLNNNDTLESQIHYILLHMRMVHWMVQNYLILGFDNNEKLQELFNWYKASYERLVQESFAPGYYDQLFALKASPSLKRVVYSWKKNGAITAKNAHTSHDYIYHLTGNRSQAPPDSWLRAFMEQNKDTISPGIAIDIGSADGTNSLFLAGFDMFNRIIAVDPSAVAINRIKQLPVLDPRAEKIMPVQHNILTYKYPGKQTPVLQRASLLLLDDTIGSLAKNERVSLMARLKDALRSQGYLVITCYKAEGTFYDQLKESSAVTVRDNNTVVTENPYQDTIATQFFTEKKILDELSAAGFDKESYMITVSDITQTGDSDSILIVIRQK